MKKTIVAIIISITMGIASEAFAVVRDLIPIGGMLFDADNNPIDGTVDVTFSLYSTESGGTAIWSDTFADMQVDMGYIIVYLGSGKPLDFANYLENTEIWVGIKVGADPEMGRVPLASVPFAVESEVCSQLGSLSESDVLTSETDPAFSESAAAGISGTDVDNWNAAYGWGDHEGQYIPAVTCPAGQFLGSNGAGWECMLASGDGGGDITGVAAGDGLKGGGTAGDVTLSVDTATVQSRVSGTCAAGSSISTIAADGSVICEPDDVGGAPPAWGISGNAGTDPAINFIGTTDIVSFDVRVSGKRAMRFEPGAYWSNDTANIIGGSALNYLPNYVSGATIAGGGDPDLGPNKVTNDWGAVGGGVANTADRVAVVGGGSTNTASGVASVVPGGQNNVAAGAVSFAAGNRAKATLNGCFVWGDTTDDDVSCSVANQFVARASGGVFFSADANFQTFAYLAPGSGTWNSYSDRNGKDDIRPADSADTLEKVASMPISTWSYKSEDHSIRHMGPMSQDFHTAFGLGPDDKSIAVIDADGVALAAIQGLNQKVEEESEDLRLENDDLKRRLASIEARLELIEKICAR